MDGFTASKLYTAIGLHFSKDKFNVFENRGRLRGTLETFEKRRDSKVFDKWARNYVTEKFILLVAANCMYGNPKCVYDVEQAESNFKEYQRRRQSITKVFADDLDTIGEANPDGIMALFVGGKITLETCVILNELEGMFERDWPAVLTNTVRLIKKSSGFVKYNKEKIMEVRNG